MFKKPGPEETRSEPTGQPSRPTEPAAPQRPAAPRETATIGPSICIRGDLTGDEDLVVQGRVEGTVTLTKNLVTIGKDGHVNATVNARVINVEGHVEGDLNGEEQVVLQRSGNVQGNITAPRVTLEDGCRFKGSIDMDVEAAAARPGGAKIADLKPAGPGGDDARTAAVKPS